MNFTNADKQALIDGIATIPFRINIIQDGSIVKTLDENSIVNIDYEDFRYVDTDSLIIGQFVARKIVGNLDKIYTDFEIEDTELELQMGVSYNDTTNYYSLGNFLVTKPTTDDVKEKTSFEALDYTKKFNTVFDGEQLTYPCTALELATECCRQAGVELATLDFANYDFEIPNNQYVESDTCRKVMQDIGKLAYSWVRIGWDNKCYIDYAVSNTIDEYNVITNDNYYDLSLQKEVFGPVNRIVVGMRDVEGENVVIEDSASILENGVTELRIYDNNITYTPELRQAAISAASRLFGLTYTPLETNTTGHPWLIGSEKIQVNDMNDNSLYTYPWDRTIVYNGHIKSKITSKADTKTETEYRNYGTIESEISKTRIIVDKQNQTIEALAEQVQPISNSVSRTGSIQLTNAYEGTLHNLEIVGSINRLYPRTDLYPASDLYPLDTVLLVDDNEYHLGFTFLGYLNDTYYDKYVYEDGKSWIERNTYIDSNGVLQPLGSTVIENLPDITISVYGSSLIRMKSFPSVKLSSTYLLQNDYTDTFATNVDIVSRINIAPGTIAIQSNKIALEGYTTINGNFSVDLEGNMAARNGTFEGNVYLSNGGRVIGGDGILTNFQFYSYGVVNGWGPIGFTVAPNDMSTIMYQDLCIDYNIPENFTISEAKLTLYTSRIMSGYNDVSTYENVQTTGVPTQLKLYEGITDTTYNIFWSMGTEYYFTEDLEVGSEIENAFGSSSYTPSINDIGDVASVTTIDLKNYLSDNVGNNQLIIRTNRAKPADYTTNANRKIVAENSGMARAVLNVIGYISVEEEE